MEPEDRKWWAKAYGDVKQNSINISFSHPPVRITVADLPTTSTSESSTDESLAEPRPRNSEPSSSTDVVAIKPSEKFESDVVGSDDQPDGSKYPFVRPDIEITFPSVETILKNEDKNEKKPKR